MDIPNALEPLYITEFPNQPIELYSGIVEICQQKTGGSKKEIRQVGEGKIFLDWFPFPTVRFEVLFPNKMPTEEELNQFQEQVRTHPIQPVDLSKLLTVKEDFRESCLYLGKASMGIEHVKSIVNIDISRVLSNYKTSDFKGSFEKISGSVENIETNESTLVNIRFHLTNFSNVQGDRVIKDNCFLNGRLFIHYQDWKLVVDPVANLRKEIEPSLRDKGGFHITHIAELSKQSDGGFSVSESEDFLSACSYLLSFCRGIWIAPLLAVGCDFDSNQTYRDWRSYNATPWQQTANFTWFAIPTAESLEQLQAGFFEKWSDANWNRHLKLAIRWYVEANRTIGGLEGPIIILQTALELLASVYFENNAVALGIDFLDWEDRHSASQRVNGLFKALRIPKEIPDTLTELRKPSVLDTMKPYAPNNGFCTLTKVRNNIAHSDSGNREIFETFSKQFIIEAYQLGLWYVELVILKICGYDGLYYNRVSGKDHLIAESLPVA